MFSMKYQRYFTYLFGLLSILLSSCATSKVIDHIDRVEQVRKDYYKDELNENINGLFPERIFIKTKTQTFNSLYEFQLYDGKIYYKDIAGKKPQRWILFKSSGLPQNLFDLGFIEPEAIVELSADSSELYALGDNGIIYRIMFKGNMLNGAWSWTDRTGWPTASSLRLDRTVDGYRSWAMGKRGEEVLWYEDINGNQHHYGTMGIATHYFLCEDGQEIRFADTGLPADFSHNILGPERGRFIARALSASASTVFLINSAGEMYTRLIDFDTVGSDPMFFKYTYDREYRDPRPGSDYSTNFNYWALPAEDWKKQPMIQTEGQAVLTDRITILQNGYGNAARELRVAGLNADGNAGYYYKQLNEQAWSFVVEDINIRQENIINSDQESSDLRGASFDKDYPGRMWYKGNSVDELSFKLNSFNLYEGSAVLSVYYGEQEIEIPFYPVEMWTYLKRDNPGRDGTEKQFLATLEINPEELSHLTPEFRQLIHKYFSPISGKLFGLIVQATTDYVYIYSSEDTDDDEYCIELMFTHREVLNTNPHLLRLYSYMRFMYEDELFDPSRLIIDKDDNKTIMEVKADANRDMLRLIQDRIELEQAINQAAVLSANTYGGIEPILNITGVSRIDYPKIRTITMHSGKILETIKRSADFQKSCRSWYYEMIQQHIEHRIQYYEDKISGNEGNVYFSESYKDYLENCLSDTDEYIDECSGGRINTELMEFMPVFLLENGKDMQYLIMMSSFEELTLDYLRSGKKGIVKIPAKAAYLNSNHIDVFVDIVVEIKNQEIYIIF